jgi:hypothetical protein
MTVDPQDSDTSSPFSDNTNTPRHLNNYKIDSRGFPSLLNKPPAYLFLITSSSLKPKRSWSYCRRRTY